MEILYWIAVAISLVVWIPIIVVVILLRNIVGVCCSCIFKEPVSEWIITWDEIVSLISEMKDEYRANRKEFELSRQES